MKYSILIPTFDNLVILIDCLKSIERYCPSDTEVIVDRKSVV